MHEMRNRVAWAVRVKDRLRYLGVLRVCRTEESERKPERARAREWAKAVAGTERQTWCNERRGRESRAEAGI